MHDFNRDVIEDSCQRPILVEFYANWCDHCKMLGPVLDEAIKSAPHSLRFVKINETENKDLAVTLGVFGLPDVRLFVDGKQVGGFAGFRPKSAVEQFIKDSLAPGKA